VLMNDQVGKTGLRCESGPAQRSLGSSTDDHETLASQCVKLDPGKGGSKLSVEGRSRRPVATDRNRPASVVGYRCNGDVRTSTPPLVKDICTPILRFKSSAKVVIDKGRISAPTMFAAT
jgi:hypothetical protein